HQPEECRHQEKCQKQANTDRLRRYGAVFRLDVPQVVEARQTQSANGCYNRDPQEKLSKAELNVRIRCGGAIIHATNSTHPCSRPATTPPTAETECMGKAAGA